MSLNTLIFHKDSIKGVSYIGFWISLFFMPLTMGLRWKLEGFDLFEQVIFFLSWIAIIETFRNSVITCNKK